MLDQIPISGKCVTILENCDVSPFVHTFLAHSAKQGRKICLVSFNQSKTYYHNVGARLGWNPQQAELKNNYMIVDALSCFKSAVQNQGESNSFSFLVNNEHPLQSLSASIGNVLTDWSDSTVTLILDRLDCLFSLGLSMQEAASFYSFCRSFVGPSTALITSTAVNPEDTQIRQYCNLLSHSSDLVLTVRGLQTGLSKDLTGSVTVSWSTELTRNLHFKCFDRGVRIFAPGTCTAVL